MVSSSHLVMLPEDVLCVVGNMGKAQARVLCNYVKHSVLPLLGLKDDYDEPKISSPDKGNERTIGVREDLWQLEDEDKDRSEDEDEDHSKDEDEDRSEDERSNEDMRSM